MLVRAILKVSGDAAGAAAGVAVWAKSAAGQNERGSEGDFCGRGFHENSGVIELGRNLLSMYRAKTLLPEVCPVFHL
ncbi:hypothetical protein LP414_16970 [Polaromonas sp. P1(28)-13]|nr:hypothetical protein LP414_16970 [Polaromonas sp. P1(28)-13]